MPRSSLNPAAHPAAAGRLWFEPLFALFPHEITQLVLRKGEVIYAQGQKTDGVYFVKKGKVRRSVLSKSGQEVVWDILKPGEFCGEGCLLSQMLRVSTTTTVSTTVVVKVEKAVLTKALHDSPGLCEAFLAHLLARNIVVEKDICGQLLSHLENKLAHTLLKLSRLGPEAAPSEDPTIAVYINQKMLAEMSGISHVRINTIMSQFRRLGLVDYSGESPDGEVRLHPKLLIDVVLSD